MKQMTNEELEVYKDTLHALHFASSVTIDSKRVGDILNAISAWSYAHRRGNGELSDKEQQLLVETAFRKLKEVLYGGNDE